MAGNTIPFRIDPELKAQFADFCDETGMSMSSALTVFIKKVVRDNKFPFAIKGDIPNAGTIVAMKEIEAMRKNPQLGKTYTDVSQMFREILGPDWRH